MNCRITSPQLRSHWDRKLVLTIIQSVRRSWPFCTAQWQKCDDKFAIMGGWSALTASSRLYWLEHYIWLQSGQPRAAAVYTQWGTPILTISDHDAHGTEFVMPGELKALHRSPPALGCRVQVVNICVLVFLLRFLAAIFVNFKIQQLLCRFGVSIFLLRHISQAPADE